MMPSALHRLIRPFRRPALAGVLAAERFAAPPGTTAIRLPLSVQGTAADITITLLGGAGDLRTVRLPHGAELSEAVLAFAALGDGRGLGVIITAGGVAAVTGPSQARAAWRRLLRRPPIAVDCDGAVPGWNAIRIRPGRAETITVVSVTRPEGQSRAFVHVDRFWRENGGLYLEGWLHADAEPVLSARIVQQDGQSVVIAEHRPRPDVLRLNPALPADARPGFAVHLPHCADTTLHVVLETAAGPVDAFTTVPLMEPDGTFAWDDPAALAARPQAAWTRFWNEINDRHLEVLEVGARVVAQGSVDLRPAFAGARRYAGMDIHPAPGLDYVGDAHALSTLVGPATFDALFSSAVMEHLAMPWLAAAEMNRALRPGGLVFHSTHQCWPVHERPNDFFRFSDEALRVLFGPAHGFETLEAGMAMPMAAYPRDKSHLLFNQTPFNPTFGQAWILARKVAEVPAATADGEAARGLADFSRRYPAPSSA